MPSPLKLLTPLAASPTMSLATASDFTHLPAARNRVDDARLAAEVARCRLRRRRRSGLLGIDRCRLTGAAGRTMAPPAATMSTAVSAAHQARTRRPNRVIHSSFRSRARCFSSLRIPDRARRSAIDFGDGEKGAGRTPPSYGIAGSTSLLRPRPSAVFE